MYTPVLLAILGTAAAPGGAAGTLAGVVSDSAGDRLSGVRVVIVEARRNTFTDELGRYRFVNLPEGNYAVTFSAVGFRPQTRRVSLSGDVILNVRLAPVRIELSPVQVTATADAGVAALSPQPTSIVQDVGQRGTTPSLGAALEDVVGVRSLSTGQGVGKPVIRGLTSNRVLVLEDGVRLESAQWGDEHGPQVEALEAERIEVIRGPASVLYGSDALGGVVNVVSRELPDAIGRAPFFAGRGTLGYASGSTARDGGLQLEAARGALGLRGSLVGRRAGDARAPAGPLFNSGLEALHASGAAGVRGSWGHAAVDVVHRTERIEIHEDPEDEPGATPFQRVSDSRVRADVGLPLGASRLALRAGWQRNLRREFEVAGAADPALRLVTSTLTGDAHLHHAPYRGWNGIIGVSLLRTSTGIGGEETLVPANRASGVGMLAFEERDFGALHLSAGLRFDTRLLDVDENDALGVGAQRRRYNAVSGNLGMLVPVGGVFSLVTSLGRAWRAPSAFELFASGVHEGARRFEVGDSTLRVESSLNLDVGLRFQGAHARGEIGGFVNRISDFIYAAPTGDTEPESGLQVFRHTQGDAVLAGFEAAADVHPTPWLEVTAQADYTRGQNTATDRPLPQIPPLRASVTIRLERESNGALRSLFFSGTGVGSPALPESRRDPEDFRTEGYALLHLGAGARVLLGAQVLSLDGGVRNVFDKEYRDFLSRYKRYAPEMGRSLFLRVAAEF